MSSMLARSPFSYANLFRDLRVLDFLEDGGLLGFSSTTLLRGGGASDQVMPEYMNLEWLMQEQWFRPDDFQALPFGCGSLLANANQVRVCIILKDLSFIAPRDKRCLPAQSSSMHA